MLGRLLSLLLTAGVCAVHAAAGLTFEWAAPAPHRQGWRSLAAGNGNVVGLTEGFGGRSIFTLVNGSEWVPVTSPTNAVFTKVEFIGDQFVAIGANATVITSKDGLDWKLRHTATAGQRLIDFAYGNGVYVAITPSPYAVASTDLVKWSPAKGLGTGYVMYDVAFGNGKFIALGQYGQLFTSSDGINWKGIAWPVGLMAEGNSIGFNNGVFVMSVVNGMAQSMDGVTWTLQPNPHQVRSAIACGNGFVGLAADGVYESVHGANWTRILAAEAAPVAYLRAYAYMNGTTYIGGDKGLFYSSNDRVSWTRLLKETNYTDSKMAFGGGIFLRYGGETGVCVSSNESDWQRVETAPGLKAAVFGNGTWVAFAHDGSGAVSLNGKVWESVTLPAAGGERIEFADGRFVGEAAGGILTSADGHNWQFIALEGRVRLIGRANGIWAAASNNQPVTSADGVNWTIHPEQNMGAAVYAAGNGRFVGIAGGGMGPGSVKISTNGITWESTPLQSGTTHTEQSLTFAGGLFILTDNYGGVYSSADGVNWTGERQAEQIFTSASYGNGQWLVCGGDSVLRSSARIQSKMAANLQLVQQNFTTWSLTVSGSAGETFQIDSSSDLNGAWQPFGVVTITSTGQTVVPVPAPTGARFFRARLVAE